MPLQELGIKYLRDILRLVGSLHFFAFVDASCFRVIWIILLFFLVFLNGNCLIIGETGADLSRSSPEFIIFVVIVVEVGAVHRKNMTALLGV